jgi:hypothetical protein
MTEKRWKAQERRIARALNCRRLRIQGEPGADLENEFLKIQVKDREDLPAWLLAGLANARGFATPRQLGVLVITSKSTRQALVVMDLIDYQSWYVGTPRKEKEGK